MIFGLALQFQVYSPCLSACLAQSLINSVLNMKLFVGVIVKSSRTFVSSSKHQPCSCRGQRPVDTQMVSFRINGNLDDNLSFIVGKFQYQAANSFPLVTAVGVFVVAWIIPCPVERMNDRSIYLLHRWPPMLPGRSSSGDSWERNCGVALSRAWLVRGHQTWVRMESRGGKHSRQLRD